MAWLRGRVDKDPLYSSAFRRVPVKKETGEKPNAAGSTSTPGSSGDGCLEYVRGEVVYARLKNMMPWPAIIDHDPFINVCLMPLNEPKFVHVFLLALHQRAWLPMENVTPFNRIMETPDPYTNALNIAIQALQFSREERVAHFMKEVEEAPMYMGPKTLT